ncbi:vesicle-associated membrane protein 726 [Pyrus ussuriensis x Pyrus communis]|uniref:Vesicle-associated membrane protein 726 n=1 Tax=Pyrus ussuriensis x Pyrus communis TaxID=2448454 RepID=A0A5N5GZQ5_9ROSA|nr:vesicle-associated membrane protein 726 [Pyrus ussuriensis x Pyrus communis]
MPTWPLKKTDPEALVGLGLKRILFATSKDDRGEMMDDVAHMSALHHVAFGLLGWQLLPGLSFGPAQARSPAHAGLHHSGYLGLFLCLSLGLEHTVEVLLTKSSSTNYIFILKNQS